MIVCFCIELTQPCPIKGQIRQRRARASKCQTKCSEKYLFNYCYDVVTSNYEILCDCPEGTLIDEFRNECAPRDECTKRK